MLEHAPPTRPPARRGPSVISTGSASTTASRRVEAIVSASCRPTWAISETGRNAAIEISTSSGSIVGAIMPCVTSTAPTAATASPPRPVTASSAAAWNDRSRQQRQPQPLIATAPPP